jgi:hexosaminidase
MKRNVGFPKLFLLLALVAASTGCRARLEPPAAELLTLIPQPLQAAVSDGHFLLAPGTLFLSAGVEAGDAEWRETARVLGELQAWLKTLGWTEAASSSKRDAPQATVVFALDPDERQRLGDEGYALRITRNAVVLSAARPAGLFYGTQTLRQLVLGRLDARKRPSWPVALPCLDIVDRPRFSWRGFMLDCCRHYFPPAFIRECLDGMALHKLNRFHWHLTDDQAWRLEIRKYPQLTAQGAFRDQGGAPYGGFYSQDEVRGIVAYAAERFITVVPEIEMPGHATAALNIFPDLSCTGGPFARMAQWGVFEDVYCAGNDRTIAFLQDVLAEAAGLFPGPWVHIGGDECPKSRWNACPKCQARIKAEGLADSGGLQSWLVRRMESHLSARGKRLIGWDEILEGGLPPNVTVMSWRGSAGGIEAARQGHDVVMAPTGSVYLDYYQGEPRFEPPAIGGFLPLATVYAFEPCPPGLSAREAAHVLGGQANLWTEYVATPGHASYMMWPRLCALAEAVWSPPAGRDWNSFLARLGKLRPGLELLGMRVAETAWRPVISAIANPRRRSWRVEMTAGVPGARIRFTRDGGDPGPRSKKYRRPFACRNGGLVRSALFADRAQLGPAVELQLRKHLAAFAPAHVSTSGRLQPETGGEALLVDGLSGSLRHDDGAWLGVEGGDLEAVIDLGRSRDIRRVTARFLEHPSAWIFPPTDVEVAVSPDGRSWTPAAATHWPAADDFTVLAGREADARFQPLRARYVRLTARGSGVCPPGHAGAGGKAWLFTDEIVVE